MLWRRLADTGSNCNAPGPWPASPSRTPGSALARGSSGRGEVLPPLHLRAPRRCTTGVGRTVSTAPSNSLKAKSLLLGSRQQARNPPAPLSPGTQPKRSDHPDGTQVSRTGGGSSDPVSRAEEGEAQAGGKTRLWSPGESKGTGTSTAQLPRATEGTRCPPNQKPSVGKPTPSPGSGAVPPKHRRAPPPRTACPTRQPRGHPTGQALNPRSHGRTLSPVAQVRQTGPKHHRHHGSKGNVLGTPLGCQQPLPKPIAEPEGAARGLPSGSPGCLALSGSHQVEKNTQPCFCLPRADPCSAANLGRSRHSVLPPLPLSPRQGPIYGQGEEERPFCQGTQLTRHPAPSLTSSARLGSHVQRQGSGEHPSTLGPR